MTVISPDAVFLNGSITTLAPDRPRVEALASLGGRIVALGTTGEIAALVGPTTRVVDLAGLDVIPGIVESHAHPDSYAIKRLKHHALSPDRFATLDDVLDHVDRTTRDSVRDAWFVGYRYNDQKQGGWPSLEALDAASHGRPLFIWRTDHHVGLANSAAMARVGIDDATANPAFGHIDRDGNGHATGLLRESAMYPLTDLIGETDTVADIADGLVLVFEEFAASGITSVVNSLAGSKSIAAYQAMRADGRLALRVGLLASGREDGLVESLIAAGIRSGFGDEWIHLVGVEWCPDCSTSGRTAAYHEPYRGTPALGEPRPNTGILLYEKDDLAARVEAAHAAGLQVCLDGVGDRGIDFCLDIFEAALAAHPRKDHRMRVEHCCHVTAPILERLKRSGVVDSSATGFMSALGDAYIANRGPEAMAQMWPHRTLIDAGLMVPGHSDAPVASSNPFHAIAALVTRRTDTGGDLCAAEAITAEEALRCYTTLGAWCARQENDKGSLEIGKLADLVALDRDLLSVPADEIRDTEVVMTVVGGVPVYVAPDWSAPSPP